MTYRFIACQTESELEQYILYMLEHKQDIHSAFTAKRIIHFMKEQLLYGQAVMVLNHQSEAIAAAGFVYGTPENGFMDPDTIRVEMVHIIPAYRGTRLFLQGIVWLARYLEQHAPAAKQVQFYSESKPAQYSRLFWKLADLIVTEPTRFGLEDEFQTTVERLRQWESKLVRRR